VHGIECLDVVTIEGMMRLKPLLNLMSDQLYALPLLVLYITDGCNSRCVTCDIWKNPRRNMPLALAQELANTVAELGIRWVLISGGEAMQHPEWTSIAQMFRQQGVRVMMLTNGLFIKRQAQQLVDHIDDLIISLDGGNAQTYHAIRGVDAFDLILDGMRELRDSRLVMTTRTTVQKANFREIPQIIDVALSNGAQSASFLAVDTSNPYAFGDRPTTDPMIALSLPEIAELETMIEHMEQAYAPQFANRQIAESPQKLRRILVQYFRALHGESHFQSPACNAPHVSTIVEVDGTLRPCYFLPSYGRFKPNGETFPQALNSSPAQALRQAYRTGKRPECAKCVCPLYKSPRELVKM
jgi:MoaA/NifB/PqqE/SkfB family radical SAM enzyme